MKCWTCGHPVSGHSFDCGYCRNLKELQAFHRDTTAALKSAETRYSSTAVGLTDLADIQRQGFAEISRSLEDGLEAIAAAVSWGFQEVKWAIEQQTTVLRGIDHTLRTPRETQANELRGMAEELRRRGVLDESEEFFVKALDLNRLDYRIYIGLAETYLREEKFDLALAILERSLAHAPKKEIDYKSYSLRLIGHVHECAEDYSAAAAKAREAVTLSPTYAEAHYDCAKYTARVGDVDGAVKTLQCAIETNPLYWYTSATEGNFSSCRSDINRLLETLWRNTSKRVKDLHDKAEVRISRARGLADAADELWRRLGKPSSPIGFSAPTYEIHIDTAAKTLAGTKAGLASGDYAKTLGVTADLLKADAEAEAAIRVATEQRVAYEGALEKRRRTRKAWTQGVLAYFLVAGIWGALAAQPPDTALFGFGRGVAYSIFIPIVIACILAALSG